MPRINTGPDEVTLRHSHAGATVTIERIVFRCRLRGRRRRPVLRRANSLRPFRWGLRQRTAGDFPRQRPTHLHQHFPPGPERSSGLYINVPVACWMARCQQPATRFATSNHSRRCFRQYTAFEIISANILSARQIVLQLLFRRAVACSVHAYLHRWGVGHCPSRTAQQDPMGGMPKPF